MHYIKQQTWGFRLIVACTIGVFVNLGLTIFLILLIKAVL